MPKPLPEPEPAVGQRLPDDHLAAAARAAVEATDNTQQLALIVGFLKAQEITRAAQPQPCHHAPPRPPIPVGRYLAIAIVGCFLVIAVMVSLVLATICAVCLTACLLVLRSMWREYQNDKGG